jgi:hypothetical protein
MAKAKLKQTTEQDAETCTLTPEQAASCALSLRKYHLQEDDGAIARFLLLLRAFTFTEDMTERETLLYTIEPLFTPFMRCIDVAVSNAVQEQLNEVRKLKSVA